MKHLLPEIDAVASKEYERILELYPIYHSDHEGVAIIEDSMVSAKYNIETMDMWFNRIKRDCFSGAYAVNFDKFQVEIAMDHCKYAIGDLIEMYARLHKYIYSNEERNAKSKKEEE